MGDRNVLERILSGHEKPTNLALALLQEITENFSDDRKIGKGGFAEVYKGVLQNKNIAVKKILLNKHTIDDELFDREVKNLMMMEIISHPNVVRFLGFCANNHYEYEMIKDNGEWVKAQIRERLLCFDYISNGSLDKHITDELRGLEWSKRYEIIKGICNGLHHLHEEKNIIHMDLTPGNIMLDTEMVPKITDFGLSRLDKSTHTTSGPRYLTRGYCAPEYENGGKPSKMADVYSLGVIITELITGRKVDPNKNQVLRWWGYRWKKSQKHSPILYLMQLTQCMKIAALCRIKEPTYRPSISDITSMLMRTETNVDAAQINDEMLGIEPLTLMLPSELQKQTYEVKLTNETNDYYAFIIRTDCQQYHAQPDQGIVSPQSNYGIQITIQAQNTTKDDIIVKSTIGYKDLRAEHITQYMSKKDPNEVDEVPLVVVMCNSDTAEALLKDHHRNFHPPQSFSSYHPTNMRYLSRPSDRAMDLATGAMGSLLHKLGELLKECNLEDSVKKDIESFSEELTKMQLVLRKLPDLHLNDQDYYLIKRWANNVREMSYDIEDFVDGFLVHSEPTSDAGGFRVLTHRVFKAHPQISDKIKDIKKQVQDEIQKRQEYNVDNVVANAPAEITDTIVPCMSWVPSFKHQKDLVGIEEQRNELIKRFSDDGDGDGDVNVQLKIFSIYGSGGLGKTTLVREVYDRLKGGQFHLKAFISVGQNRDKKDVIGDIIKEFIGGNFNAENSNEEQLIAKLQRLLENKRYIIVIDDIWDSNIIESVFLGNNCASRVVITTRVYSVAIACCKNKENVYEMRRLNEQDSRALFVRRIYGTEEACNDVPEEILTGILKKCGGLPLAIVSIASLLRAKDSRQRSTWDYVRKSLVALFEGDNPTLKEMEQILDLSYRHLPHHLRTCLLSVCKYREDHEIEKDELLRQWIAEGFVIATTHGLDVEDVAEDYLEELINMSMIQPEKIDYNDEVLSCRVHDIVLDLIRSKAAQENFCLVIDGSKDVRQPPEKARRVSVHYHSEMDGRTLAVAATSGSLAHVRSVTLFSRCRYDISSFLTLKYVRVLHLEDGTSKLNLSSISELFLLRYLKIVCYFFSTDLELPNRFEELQELETIDVRSVTASSVPQGIVSLPRLLHLSVGNFSGLPEGISRLKFLCTLGCFNLAATSVDNIKCLGDLTNLRDLTICWWRGYHSDPMDAAMRMEALRSSIVCLSESLRSLIIGPGCNIQLPVHGWNSAHSLPVRNLRKLDLTSCDFDKCPGWISELHDLYSLRIRVKEVADGVSIVAELPSLAYLYLKCHGEKEEEAVISGFRALKHLDLDCEKLSLTFQAGAMPRLEKIEMVTGYVLPRGIEHLPTSTLRQICLKVVDVDTGEQRYNPLVGPMFDIQTAFRWHHPSAQITYYSLPRICQRGWRYPSLMKGRRTTHLNASIGNILGADSTDPAPCGPPVHTQRVSTPRRARLSWLQNKLSSLPTQQIASVRPALLAFPPNTSLCMATSIVSKIGLLFAYNSNLPSF